MAATTGPATHNAAERYDVFMSYSHAADGALGPALQAELERFGGRWRRRVRRVFRDDANLAADPRLWGAVERALAASEWFLLLASPDAARSEWVEREARWWLEHRDPERILIVDTTPARRRRSFEQLSALALPPSLRLALHDEPRFADLSWLGDRTRVDRSDPRFEDAVADVAARVSGVSKDALVGEHLRQQRRARRTVRGVVAGLSLLFVLAVVAAAIAISERNEAQRLVRETRSRLLASEAAAIRDSRPDLSRQLLLAAYRFSPTDQAVGGILTAPETARVTRVRGGARDVAYSPAGDVLAIAADSGIELHDPATGALLDELTGQGGYVDELAFAAGGRVLVSGNADGSIWLSRIRDRAPPAKLPFGDTLVTRVAASTQAPVFAASLPNGATGIFTIDDPARPVRRAVFQGDPARSGDGLALREDGRLLALNGDENRMRLFDLSRPSAPRELATFEGSTGWPVAAAAFSPDGALLATSSQDQTVRLFEVSSPRTPRLLGTLNGSGELAFSRDGRTLAVADGAGRVALWDLSDPFRPQLATTLTGHRNLIGGVMLSPDGRTLAVASADVDPERGDVRRWNVAGALRTAATAVLAPRFGVASFSADGRRLAVGSPSTLWDPTTPERPRLLAGARRLHQNGAGGTLSPDGRLLVSGSPPRVVDVSDPARPRVLAEGAAAAPSAPPHVSFGAGSDRVAIASGDGAELWSLRDPARPRRLSRLVPDEVELSLSGDGRVLAMAWQWEERLELWDVSRARTPQRRARVTVPGGQAAIALSRDGRTLFTGSPEGVVRQWDLRDLARPKAGPSVNAHAGEVDSIAVDARGERVATSGAGAVRLWRRQGLSPLVTFESGSSLPAALTFSPDGRELVAAGAVTEVWDLDAARITRRMCAESAPITRTDWGRYAAAAYDPPCGAAPRIVAKAPPPAVATPPAPEPASRPVRAGDARQDIRATDWSKVPVDGAFCDVPGLVAFGPALSTTHGPVQLGSVEQPRYADLAGDRREEAVRPVACDNGGGTAGGQLGFAHAVYALRGRDLVLLGTVTSRRNPPGVHVTLLSEPRLSRGRITVREHWYRDSDGTCCPTGEARTRWTVRASGLTPGPPEVLR